jgi:hypothetical protein
VLTRPVESQLSEGGRLSASADVVGSSYQFNEHGVQIMSPHYESDPRGRQSRAEAELYAAPAQREESQN